MFFITLQADGNDVEIYKSDKPDDTAYFAFNTWEVLSAGGYAGSIVIDCNTTGNSLTIEANGDWLGSKVDAFVDSQTPA